jgi:hypothetical protein
VEARTTSSGCRLTGSDMGLQIEAQALENAGRSAHNDGRFS